jgi:hypothetical protein
MSKNSQVTTLDSGAAKAGASQVAAEPAAKELNGSNADLQLSGERKVVTIYEEKGEGGSDAVFLSINGYAYQIPRGKPWDVPAEVVEVLQNAVTRHVSMGEGGAINEVDIPRYNFRVENAPSRAAGPAKAADPVAA